MNKNELRLDSSAVVSWDQVEELGCCLFGPQPREKLSSNISRTYAKIQYSEYLKSPHWKAKREIALLRAGNACQICNMNQGLDVHHRTYVRLGDEWPEDLTVLCRPCHDLHHRERGAVKRSCGDVLIGPRPKPYLCSLPYGHQGEHADIDACCTWRSKDE